MSSGESYAENGPAEIEWSTKVDALVVQLPHQCDEWVIGGAEQVRALLADLQALLPEFDHPERYRHVHHCARCGKAGYRRGAICSDYCQSKQDVCIQCFYPAQDERRLECQAARHPEQTCQMPWCQTCFWCSVGCRCERPGRTFGSPSTAPVEFQSLPQYPDPRKRPALPPAVK